MRSWVEKEKRSSWQGKPARSSGSAALGVQHRFCTGGEFRRPLAGLQLHPPNQNSTHDVTGWVEDFIFKQQLVYDFFSPFLMAIR